MARMCAQGIPLHALVVVVPVNVKRLSAYAYRRRDAQVQLRTRDPRNPPI